MKGDTYRLSRLIGMEVYDTDGRARGVVADARASRTGRGLHGARIEGLVLTAHHTGSMLGYDRGANTGPVLVRWFIRWLHRDARFVPWSGVVALDWEQRRVTIDAGRVEPLRRV